jgi:hypothetical protein
MRVPNSRPIAGGPSFTNMCSQKRLQVARFPTPDSPTRTNLKPSWKSPSSDSADTSYAIPLGTFSLKDDRNCVDEDHILWNRDPPAAKTWAMIVIISLLGELPR